MKPKNYFKSRITLLVGHRGVGKSNLLERISHYFGSQLRTVDLDQEISRQRAVPLERLFVSEFSPDALTEAQFRIIERQTLIALIKSQYAESAHRACIIALGAGFELDVFFENLSDFFDFNIREELDCIWIKRVTDLSGRIFLDRPRLSTKIENATALAEYNDRYTVRNLRFNKYASRQLLIPEGWRFKNNVEKDFFLGTYSKQFAYKTEQTLLSLGKVDPRFQFEIKTNLDGFKNASKELSSAPLYDFRAQMLISFRSKVDLTVLLNHSINCNRDWAVELGNPPDSFFDLPQTRDSVIFRSVSLHDRLEGESILDAAKRLEQSAKQFCLLKFAPIINNFEELLEGHLWALQNIEQRSFLPRSPDQEGALAGRWIWYRLFTKGLFKIQFVRDGNSDQPDLPLTLDWLRSPTRPQVFGAVLGFPVQHSFSPSEHWKFFENHNLGPFFAIPVQAEEFDSALDVLQKLGLRFVALTSPLKKCFSRNKSSLNTLFYSAKKASWVSINTDELGVLKVLGSVAQSESVAVWGGGGMLESIQSVAAKLGLNLHFFSARTGKERKDGSASLASFFPDVVIWAAPQMPDLKYPSENWAPRRIIDLSYTADSPGLEYALRVKANYTSGLELFCVQAKGQQVFWKAQLEENQ